MDMLMVSETKLDDNFPVSQLLVDGYTPFFRLNCDNNGYNYGNNARHNGFVREDIACKRLSV